MCVSPRHLGTEAPYCSPADCWRGLQTCDCKSPSFDGEEVEGRIWSHLEWAGLQIQYFWTVKGHTYWSVHKEASLSLSLPSWIHIRSFDHRNIVCTSTRLGVAGDWGLGSKFFLLTSWGNEARFCFEVRHSARRSEQGWCWICPAKPSYIPVVCQTKLTPREHSRNRAIPPFQALIMIFAVWGFFVHTSNTQLVFGFVFFLSDHKCISDSRKLIPHIEKHWRIRMFFSYNLRFCYWTSHWE